jgi:signal transduction histidine kinase
MSRSCATVLFFICIKFSFAQNKSEIDSINNIAYETKIEKAVTLDDVFLKNALHAKKINYPLGEADSYSNLGLVYYYQGKYSENVTYILKAIKIYEAQGVKDKIATEYGGLGYSMKRRNMKMALQYMQKGKDIAESSNLQVPLLSIYNNYGVLKEMQGQLDSALYFYEKGLALKENVHDSLGIPYSLNNVAGIYVMKGKFDDAQKLYDRALKIREIRKDAIGIAENNQYFGDLYFAMKDYRKAVSYYKTSLESSLKYKYTYLSQDNYKRLAQCYELLGKYELALVNYKNFSEYKDSLLNKETNSKIAELEIGFETSKKEKELVQNGNLLLEKDAEAERKNIIIGSVSLLAIFVGMVSFLISRQQKLRHHQLKQEHELKEAFSRIETQNILQDQRIRISRDLHDNIGSQLTFIISSVDNIRYAFNIDNYKLETKLNSISNFARETIIELRDTIWAMNKSEVTFEDLQSRILNFIERAKESSDDISFKLKFDENLSKLTLSSVEGMNIYRTIQEAINNALKHASAKQITISISNIGGLIEVAISDNGRGFNVESADLGNGIANMNKRINDLGGKFEISSTTIGTSITITFEPEKLKTTL